MRDGIRCMWKLIFSYFYAWSSYSPSSAVIARNKWICSIRTWSWPWFLISPDCWIEPCFNVFASLWLSCPPPRDRLIAKGWRLAVYCILIKRFSLYHGYIHGYTIIVTRFSLLHSRYTIVATRFSLHNSFVTESLCPADSRREFDISIFKWGSVQLLLLSNVVDIGTVPQC